MKNPDTRKIEHEFAIDTAINSLTRKGCPDFLASPDLQNASHLGGVLRL